MNKKHARIQDRAKSEDILRSRKPLLIALVAGLVVVLGGILFIILRGNQAAPYTPEVAGRPKASIDQDFFDYGDVRVSTPVETVFRVRNVGDQPLTILGEPQVELIEGC